MKSCCVFIFFVVVSAASNAYAQVPDGFDEYFTYGNYDIILNALSRLALLMSDTGYNILFFTAVGISALAWGFGGILQVFRNGARINVLGGLFVMLLGSMIYIVFVRPTSDLYLLDVPTSRQNVVADVPDGVCLLANIQNRITRMVVDMISTSAAPTTPPQFLYEENAKGDIFNLIRHIFDLSYFSPIDPTNSSNRTASGKYLGKSIEIYFERCILFQVYQSNGNLGLNDFFENQLIDDLLYAGQSPVRYSLWFSNANRHGISMTCTDVYAEIMSEFQRIESSMTHVRQNRYDTPGTFFLWRNPRCEAAGYLDIDPAEDECLDKTINFLNSMGIFNGVGFDLFRTQYVASTIYHYVNTHDTLSLSDFHINTKHSGGSTAATKWLPLLQDVVFSVYLGIVPFLLLLLPTVLLPRVMEFIVGIFIFIFAWEACDALLHSYSMDMAVGVFKELRHGSLSLHDLWMMSSSSHEAYLIFGNMRWASMGMAIAVSSLVVKSGGHFFGALSGMVTSVGTDGAHAASMINDPVQRGHQIKSLPKVIPMEAITNEKGFNFMQAQAHHETLSEVVSGRKVLDTFGGNVQASGTYAGSARGQGVLDGMATDLKRSLVQELATVRQVSETTESGIKSLASNTDGLKALNNGRVNMTLGAKEMNSLRKEFPKIGNLPAGREISLSMNFNNNGDYDLVSADLSERIHSDRTDTNAWTIEKDNPMRMTTRSGEEIWLIGGNVRRQGNRLEVSNALTENGVLANYTLDLNHEEVKADYSNTLSAPQISTALETGTFSQYQIDVRRNLGTVLDGFQDALGRYITANKQVSSDINAGVSAVFGSPLRSIVGSGVQAQGGRSIHEGDAKNFNVFRYRAEKLVKDVIFSGGSSEEQRKALQTFYDDVKKSYHKHDGRIGNSSEKNEGLIDIVKDMFDGPNDNFKRVK